METSRSKSWRVVLAAASVALVVAGASGCKTVRRASPEGQATRQKLFAELTPTALANCTLKRYGDAHDGGYLMCENLMGGAQAAYSYGIDGRDQWGCDVSRQMRTTVHEYDCFNPNRPACDRGALQFHDECVGDQPSVQDGRPFDTLSNQVSHNGDGGKRLIVKMDVEGSEWASLLETPDEVLDLIDQLAIEFHGTDTGSFVETVEKLKQHFYLVHVHANNYACDPSFAPLTSWANEALFVNKRIGVLDPSGARPALPDPLDAPNRRFARDCQPRF